MPTEQEKRQHRCCFTGHRPEKLAIAKEALLQRLEAEIARALTDGMYVFISGMARGVDIWAAQLVLKQRKQNPEIKLICACPFPDFEKSWSIPWQYTYTTVLGAADLVRFISPAYSRFCFQIRNRWRVDHSRRIIAAYNGGKTVQKTR